MENKAMLNDIVSLLFGLDIGNWGCTTQDGKQVEPENYLLSGKPGLFWSSTHVSGVTENHSGEHSTGISS
jgi:hypothetical protein